MPRTPSSLHIYLITTDRGPNEVLGRKMWETLTREASSVLLFSSDCMEHAVHLLVLSGLKAIDDLLKRRGKPYKLFASLATCSNCLRDQSKQFYETWCDLHGDLSGSKCARKLWPKAIGGRWNSIHEVTTRMKVVGGQSFVEPVVKKILANKVAAADASKQKLPNDVVDEISFQEAQSYQKKMGIWRLRTLECVSDSLWWVLSEAQRISQATSNHFSATLLRIKLEASHRRHHHHHHVVQVLRVSDFELTYTFCHFWTYKTYKLIDMFGRYDTMQQKHANPN